MNPLIESLKGKVPNLDEYFGVWSIYEPCFRAMVDRVSQINLQLHVQQQQSETLAQSSRTGGRQFELAGDGVAVVGIVGTLMKRQSSLSESTSTILARRGVRQAAEDPSIKAILLHIESPGGTVSGTADLAADVAAAAAVKPVHAYIEDLGASAAYWIASPAHKIYANKTAIVGSIGTFGIITDYSEQAGLLGMKVHVIKAGEFKGAGVPGTEITKAQLAEAQRIVNELNEHFLNAVATGRRLSMAAVRELADGRVRVGQDAVTARLIDGIQSLDATISQLEKAKLQSSPGGNAAANTISRSPVQMSAGNFQSLQSSSATVAQIEAACPGASSDFVLAQFKRGASIADAKSDFIAHLSEQHKALEAAKVKRPGVSGLSYGSKSGGASDFSGDAVAEFNSLVKQQMKDSGNNDRWAAIRTVTKRNPELREAAVIASNRDRRSQSRAADYFDKYKD